MKKFYENNEIILEKKTKNFMFQVQVKVEGDETYYLPHVTVYKFNKTVLREIRKHYVALRSACLKCGIDTFHTLVEENDDTHFHFIYMFGNWEEVGTLTYRDGKTYNVMKLKLKTII